MLTWGGPSDGTAKGEVMCQSRCGTLEDLWSHLFERYFKTGKGEIRYTCVSRIMILLNINSHPCSGNFFVKDPRKHLLMQISTSGSHLKRRIFAGTKLLGRYQVQASRFMAQVIVLVIITCNAMISNDWKIGIMEES